MRRDLTEAEIRELLRRSDKAADQGGWTPDDAARLRRLVGELQSLRDREASVMQLHEIEGAY